MRYKWEVYCWIYRVFPESLEGRKVQRYKWVRVTAVQNLEVYCRANFRPQKVVLGVGVI